MRILFITMALLRQSPAGATSDIASARYRVLLPAEQLARLGHGMQVMSVPPGPVPKWVQDTACDVLVLSKSFNAEIEPVVAAMRARGTRVIVDFCDDHFDSPQMSVHFRNLVGLAHQVVASTPAMADSIRRHTGRDSIVVTDPVEGPRGTPRFGPRLPALKLVWFGGPTNLASLDDKAAELLQLAALMPVHLTIVTSPAEAAGFVQSLATRDPARLTVELVPWSLDATWKAFEAADAIWVPVTPSEKNAVKSPNRLLEPLWAGRFVVADAIPAYAEFADLVPIGKGLVESITAALADAPAVENRIREAQRRIARNHSPFACGRAWAAAIGDQAARPLRLNLGCGDKILPGYVNVDVVESRAGKKPDVICDLHELVPFADDSADEVLSVHVVEHFWRWEIRDVLREWVRVLKPGGKMIVECPNIQSACQTFLENPVQNAREDQAGQRTMWVFYGDPAWKDPLMIHRWGYTPESLKALLTEVGLVDVAQEPAQFKLREPRDMRITGRKPSAGVAA